MHFTCNICNGQHEEDKLRVSVLCGHTFCVGCVDSWITQLKKKTCPTCRKIIPSLDNFIRAYVDLSGPDDDDSETAASTSQAVRNQIRRAARGVRKLGPDSLVQSVQLAGPELDRVQDALGNNLQDNLAEAIDNFKTRLSPAFASLKDAVAREREHAELKLKLTEQESTTAGAIDQAETAVKQLKRLEKRYAEAAGEVKRWRERAETLQEERDDAVERALAAERRAKKAEEATFAEGRERDKELGRMKVDLASHKTKAHKERELRKLAERRAEQLQEQLQRRAAPAETSYADPSLEVLPEGVSMSVVPFDTGPPLPTPTSSHPMPRDEYPSPLDAGVADPFESEVPWPTFGPTFRARQKRKAPPQEGQRAKEMRPPLNAIALDRLGRPVGNVQTGPVRRVRATR